MKDSVTKFDLTAAFKALNEIEYEAPDTVQPSRLDLHETYKNLIENKIDLERLVEDYYDVNDSAELETAAEDREGEIAQAKLSRIEKIVDLDAKTVDDLLPSYVGKIIIRCPQCMTMFYKDEADIEKDPEDPTICNVNEPCQHCGNISGYELIGKVDAVSQEEAAEMTGEDQTEEPDALDLDLNFDAPEEATEEETEEAPAEEGEAETTDEDLDLDLDLDLGEDEEEKKEESLNLSKVQKDAEKNSDLATDITSEHKSLNENAENLTEDKRDDDDFYGKDIDDALIQLKKRGHAEFWCRQGKGKAEEVVKLAKEKYNLDVEYTIDDDYCEAKVVKDKKESLNNSEAQKDAEKNSDLATDITSAHKSIQEGTAAQALAAFSAKLKSMDVEAAPEVEESINKAEADENTVPENASENKSINEGADEACQECDGKDCEAKPEDELDEAVAITIGVEEVEDTVTPVEAPVDAMIVANPETDATAVYTAPEAEIETPAIEIAPETIITEPVTAEVEAEATDDADDEVDDDFDELDDTAEPEAEEAEADEDNEDDEDEDDDDDKEVEESLTESSELKELFGNINLNDIYDQYIVRVVDNNNVGHNVTTVDKTKYNLDKTKSEAKKLSAATEREFDGKTIDINKVVVIGVKGDTKEPITEFKGGSETQDGAKAAANLVQKYKNENKTNKANAKANKAFDDIFADKKQPKPEVTGNIEAGTDEETTVTAPEAEAEAEVKSDANVDKVRAALSTIKRVGGKTFSPKTLDRIIDALKAGGIITESLEEDLTESDDINAVTFNPNTFGDETPSDSPDTSGVEADVPTGDESAEEVKEEALTEETAEETTEEAPSDLDAVTNEIVSELKDQVEQDKEVVDDIIETELPAEQTAEAQPAETEAPKDEALEEDKSAFKQLLDSKVFNDFNEDINEKDIEEVDEDSINECVTKYLKEVYSNTDNFKLTSCDLKNSVLVLEGVITFNSGKTRNTSFGFNVTGKSTLQGVNESLVRGAKFELKCSLNEKKLVAESLAYNCDIQGTLVEGLVTRD